MTTEKPEKTFIMIKPDGVERRLIGEIIQRFEKKGFQIVNCRLIIPTENILKEHYAELKDKDFFSELINFMISGPVLAMVWQGKEIIYWARKMLGETNPLSSLPGTIRGDFCTDINRNIIHASDSSKSAQKEINLWFSEKK